MKQKQERQSAAGQYINGCEWLGGNCPQSDTSGFSFFTAPHLNVELKGSDGLLQHAVPLLLRQLHAVHSAAVELLEQVGAGDSGEGKERQTLVALKPHGLLGDSTQDLPSGQVTEVPGVSVSN